MTNKIPKLCKSGHAPLTAWYGCRIWWRRATSSLVIDLINSLRSKLTKNLAPLRPGFSMERGGCSMSEVWELKHIGKLVHSIQGWLLFSCNSQTLTFKFHMDIQNVGLPVSFEIQCTHYHQHWFPLCYVYNHTSNFDKIEWYFLVIVSVWQWLVK